ncbi:biotin--[acetyl-CoA-carboxylase] ligase [Haploplasma modicum]|uniref:biotin--[acetyl-CoA-carboxylase] ligase n=1 Tax=Haploplasma modicum TaxID=2150 RepID=UPI00214CF9E8|nr:biotin--[acetyl-CoA-carboxylase] ligase [Haploplasma modicum]MCR1809171.1 biotin--[acetyl-CoA-carboxylase] ligase [Haploplasma modicum]
MQLDKKIINLDIIDSTNDYLKREYLNLENKTIVKAGYQTLGRGQFDRLWQSESNQNLLFSILYKNFELDKISDLKILIKDSLLKLLSKYNIKGTFKEPNDILVNGKKILGILIESKINSNSNYYDYVIVGIGININQTLFNNLEATSFKILNNKNYIVDEILNKLLEIIDSNNF